MSGTERGGMGGAGGDNPMLAMLGRVFDVLRGIQEEQRRSNKRVDQLTTAVVSLNDQVQRLDRRMGGLERRLGDLERRLGELERRMGELESKLDDQKYDLEAMIRAELLGQHALLRAELGSRFDALEDRVAVLEGRDPWQEAARPGPPSP